MPQIKRIPLNQAIRAEIPDPPSMSTVWRWITRGLAPARKGEPRVRLVVEYVGSRPYVIDGAISDFIAKVTEARLARMEQTRDRAADVTDDELQAAGLV